MNLRIRTDTGSCIGSENCARYAPNTFATDENGTVALLAEPHDDEDAVQVAVGACPVGALSIEPTAARGPS